MSGPNLPRPETKQALLVSMLQSAKGASVRELSNATGWQAHSVRGFLSIQRRDYNIERRQRTDDVIAYYANKK